MASLHLLAEYFDVDLIKKWWRELVLLSKEPYFLPTLVVCVGVAVAITYFQDNKHVAHGAAIEESEDALDADDIPSSPSTATKEKSGNHSNGDKTSGAKKPFALPST
ncbi:hypothetical protein BGW41_004496 [Actinomortierella wolfii]|nr:hypothetical protein BGW41_004496 [Actinomortierella wolfii]